MKLEKKLVFVIKEMFFMMNLQLENNWNLWEE